MGRQKNTDPAKRKVNDTDQPLIGTRHTAADDRKKESEIRRRIKADKAMDALRDVVNNEK